VLDFEFSGRDLRVADLATSLRVWPFQVFGTGAEWPLLDAIGRGYVARLPLLPAELDALPALFHLRMIGGLLARLARYERGLMSRERLAERVALTLAHDDWLRQHERRLVDLAHGWLEPSPG
jgi:Ser/Thr protein kinase RdoA (MazF antagonist)